MTNMLGSTNTVTAIGRSSLPIGWRWARLGDVCAQDRTVVDPDSRDAAELPYLSLEHIESETGHILGTGNSSEVRSTTFAFDSRHVLYGKLRPYLNKVALPNFKGRCTTELIPLLPRSDCEREYLALALRRIETVAIAMQEKTGSRMPRADMDKLLEIEIPLPPLAEQRRIAARLTEIMVEIARARAAAQAARDATKAIPRSLLKQVFGQSHTNWSRKKIGELTTVVRGSSPRPKGDSRFYGGNVPRLMVADVTRDGMYITPRIDFLTELGATMSRPMKKGDVVMVVSGAPGLPGILAVDCCIHDGFVGFRDINSDVLLNTFFFWYLTFAKDVNDSQATGAIFRNLTTDQIKDFVIEVPAISEQKTITTKLNTEVQLGVHIRDQVLDQLDAINALPAVYLRRAFKGEI